MTETRLVPPAPTLLYMFADEVIEGDDWRSQGTQVPGREAKVKSGKLAPHLFALAFWQLASEGVLTLRLEERKRLGIRTTKVLARLTQPGRPREARLEQMLVDVLADGQERTADDVVYEALGQDYANPRTVVIGITERDGLASGCFVETTPERGLVGRLVHGSTDIQPQLDRFPVAREAFDRTMAEWQAFRSTQPALADGLLAKCEKGINRRFESDDDD